MIQNFLRRFIERRSLSYSGDLPWWTMNWLQQSGDGDDGDWPTPHPPVNGLSSVQRAAGVWSRAFAAATLKPTGNARAAAVTPELRSRWGRDLIVRGESVALIEVTGAGLRLIPARGWDISGDYPDGLEYRLDLPQPVVAPGGQLRRIRRRVPAAAVVHLRYAEDPDAPWNGLAPWKMAKLSAETLRNVEDSLRVEHDVAPGRLLPLPREVEGKSKEHGEYAPLRKGLNKGAGLKGRTLMFNLRQNEHPHPNTGEVQRVGADPPAAMIALRSDLALELLAVCGIPQGLDGGAEAARREAMRSFIHGAAGPMAEILAVEIAHKLDLPGFSFDFSDLARGDIMSRARAYGSLVGAGMDAQRAGELAGFS